jgi:hypothetical protein
MLGYAPSQSEVSTHYTIPGQRSQSSRYLIVAGKLFRSWLKNLDRRPIDPPPILRMSLDTLDPEEEQ